MDTVDLPRLVSTWIDQTHGPHPDLRAQVDCILFFVLTKFDKHPGDSAAAGGDMTRFQRRIEATLLEKFRSSADNWVEAWTPGQPFRNCFWLRNPNYYVDGLIDYDPAKREVAIKADKVARMAELKAGCLQAAAVRAHFADPARAWDAAMALNDGGVSYLVGQLTRVCKPDQKLREIEQQVARLVTDMLRALGPHHVADDVQTRIDARRAACDAIIDDLAEALGRHRFGTVLAEMMVDQDQINDHIARVPANIRSGATMSQAQGVPALGPNATPDQRLGGGGPARPARPGPVAVPRCPPAHPKCPIMQLRCAP